MAAPSEPVNLSPEYLRANHDSKIIAIAVLFPILSLLSVVGRFISKRLKHLAPQIEDYMLLSGWVIATGDAAMTILATVKYRLGWHEAAVSLAQATGFAKIVFVSNFIQSTALALTKLSLLIMLWRIFITRAFRMTTYILGGIVICWWIIVTVAGFTICLPIDSKWDPAIHGVCGNEEILDIATPVPWILTDFAILFCPLPVIKHLKLTRRKKLGLYAIFLIGTLTCVISCIRYSTLFYKNEDLSWAIVNVAILNVVESHTTVMCAALIACQPILRWFADTAVGSALRSLFPSRSQSSGSNSTYWRSTRQSRPHLSQNSIEYLRDQPALPLHEHPGKAASLNNSSGHPENGAWLA